MLAGVSIITEGNSNTEILEEHDHQWRIRLSICTIADQTNKTDLRLIIAKSVCGNTVHH